MTQLTPAAPTTHTPSTLPPAPNLYPQLILFGDSITEWPNSPSPSIPYSSFSFHSALSSLYTRRLDIINRGFSGYNTQHALHALPLVLPSPAQARVELLLIFFGANDSALPDYPSKQYVPLEVYKENLRKLVRHERVRAQGCRVLVVTVPPVDERRMEEVGFGKGRRAVVSRRYARVGRDVVEELEAEGKGEGKGVACCDLWSVLMRYVCDGAEVPEGEGELPGDELAPRSERLRKLLVDGLHFTPKAYELMFGAVKETILRTWPEMEPERMGLVLPPWAEAPKEGEEERS